MNKWCLQLLKEHRSLLKGTQLSYESVSSTGSTQDLAEDLMGVEHYVRVSKSGSALSSFKPVIVPADTYLALGDNRDNSSDSRVIGFVPRREVVGRTRSVVMSFNYDNYYIPRSDRFFHALVND